MTPALQTMPARLGRACAAFATCASCATAALAAPAAVALDGAGSADPGGGTSDPITVFIGTGSNNHRNSNHGRDMTSGGYHGNSFGGNRFGNSGGGVNQGQNSCDGVACSGRAVLNQRHTT